MRWVGLAFVLVLLLVPYSLASDLTAGNPPGVYGGAAGSRADFAQISSASPSQWLCHQNWTNLTSSVGKAPHWRVGASVTYDSHDGYVLLFGGRVPGGQLFSDTWIFHGGAWFRLYTTNAPGPRAFAAIAYDSSDGYVVLFGGSNGTSPLNDTWKFLAGSWQRLAISSAPPARFAASFADDPPSKGVLLFGGNSSSAVLSDGWMFKHGVWLGRTLGYAPSARAGAGAAWDATDKGVLVFDGYQGHKFTAIHDTWLYTNGSWKNIFSSSSHNNGPFGRVGAGVASAPPRGVVVFGGSGQRPIGGGITFVFAYSHWCSDYLSFYYGPHPDFGITVYYPGFAYDARDGYFVWFSHGQTWKFG